MTGHEQAQKSDSVQSVVPNMWRLRLDLPGHAIGHVNSYALLSDREVLLIDPGWGDDDTVQQLHGLLTRIGLGLDDVTRVLLTHFHSDHCGMSGVLQRRHRAVVGLHPGDAELLEERYMRDGGFNAQIHDWVRRTGARPEIEQAAVKQARWARDLVPAFQPDELIEDGSVISHGPWELEVLHTPGHSPGHVCLFERRSATLFSGDHLYAQLDASPAARPQSRGNPVGDYLASLERLRLLPISRVLPGHQGPVTDAAARIDEITTYHHRRLSAAMELVRDDGLHTTWDIATSMPRSRPWESLRPGLQVAALAETLGHLEHLAALGQVSRTDTVPVTWTAPDDA